MQDNLTAAITLVNRINTTENELKTLREQLRALVGSARPAPSTKKKPGRKKGQKPSINISQAVRDYVVRVTGKSVPEIMKALGLEDHEHAVRAALKKAKDVSLTSVNAKWYPIVQTFQPPLPPGTVGAKENPAGDQPNGAVRDSGWAGARYTE